MRNDKERALLAIIAIGLFCFFILFSVLAPHQVELACKPENQPVQKCPTDNFPGYIVSAPLAYIDAHNGLFQALAAFASAGFAGVLYFVTRQQATTSQKSADAARDSANAFVASERANLVIESPGIFGLDESPNEMRYDEDDIVRGYWQLKNYGKSPAQIIDVSSNLIIAAALPQPPYWGLEGKEWLEIISPNSDTRHFRYLPSDSPDFPDWAGSISTEQRKGLDSKELKIFLCVRVRYFDQFGKPHVFSGAWQGVPKNTASETIEWCMEPCGPKSYWEYT